MSRLQFLVGLLGFIFLFYGWDYFQPLFRIVDHGVSQPIIVTSNPWHVSYNMLTIAILVWAGAYALFGKNK